MTFSTAPMSMPSSSELVDTTARSEPSFSIDSMVARSSFDTEPWWARAMTAGAVPATSVAFMICAGGRRSSGDSDPGSVRRAWSSLSLLVRRSAVRRELTNTNVDRCPMISSNTRSSMKGQIDPCAGSADSVGRRPPEESEGSVPASVAPMARPSSKIESRDGTGRSCRSLMSSTGTWTPSSHSFLDGGSMISTGRSPPRKRATLVSGRTVADSPMR